jgi:hypothetical protein
MFVALKISGVAGMFDDAEVVWTSSPRPSNGCVRRVSFELSEFSGGDMPTPTPQELQLARRASGRLGGRPRKPTRDEARELALQDLVPKALKVLAVHLGDGENVNGAAWRAALRVFEFAFGRPAEERSAADDTVGVKDLSREDRQELATFLIAKFPHLVNRPAE